MRLSALPVVLIAGLVLPAGAAAKSKVNAPPGNSGLGQYVEVVPSASGARPTTNLKPKKSPLSAAQQRTLTHAGSDGRKLAGVVAETSPPAPAKRRTKTRHTPRTDGNDKSGASAVASALTASGTGGGGGGIGAPLIGLMGGAALVVGAMAFARHRRSAGGSEDELRW